MPDSVPRCSSPEPTIVFFAPVSQQPCQATAPPQLASNKPSTKSIPASLHQSTNSHWPYEGRYPSGASAPGSWRDPAGESPAQVRCSARLVVSVALWKATTTAKRTQQSCGVGY